MTCETGPHRPCVVLVGPPGAGKSTIGRKLARELGAELVDTDAVIEAETGRSIPEIFTTDGEPEFRRIEEDVVRRAVEAGDGIVSLGGGAILSAATRALLRGRTVVYLEISVAEGLRRTGAATHRPLLAGADPSAKYRELMQTRRPLYREVASVRVRTDGRSPGRVVRNILARLGLEPVEPVVTPPPADTAAAPAARKSRRRRRGGRSRGANKAAAQAVSTTESQDSTDASTTRTSDTAEQNTPATDASATGGATSTRRSRRSRRGGRRRSKSQRPAATTPDASTTAADSQSESTAAQPVPDQASAPPRRNASRADSGAAHQARSGTSRSRTRATPPRPSTETTTTPAREDAAPPRATGARRSRAAKRPAGPPTPRPAPESAAPDPEGRTSVPNTTSAHRDSDDATGRSRWSRARRARTLRAQQESEQTA